LHYHARHFLNGISIMSHSDHLIFPAWHAPANVRAFQTTRQGGLSDAPYTSLNLGDHVGDAPLTVARNRMLLNQLVPSEPVWLEQVHGTTVMDAGVASCRPRADACVSRARGAVCVVMTADCLPLLFCDRAGTVVGAAHAGWRGLADGVIEATVAAMAVAPQELMVWLGAAIGATAFEVGEEVRAVFVAQNPLAVAAFVPTATTGKYLADLYALARLRLNALGITDISGGDLCTYHDAERFFSYRREGVTGRMGALIWLEARV
jgi:YfiH family protein